MHAYVVDVDAWHAYDVDVAPEVERGGRGDICGDGYSGVCFAVKRAYRVPGWLKLSFCMHNSCAPNAHMPNVSHAPSPLSSYSPPLSFPSSSYPFHIYLFPPILALAPARPGRIGEHHI